MFKKITTNRYNELAYSCENIFSFSLLFSCIACSIDQLIEHMNQKQTKNASGALVLKLKTIKIARTDSSSECISSRPRCPLR